MHHRYCFQGINGISLATYDSDPTLYAYTLSQAIAATMIGVDASAVQNLDATDSSTYTAITDITLSFLPALPYHNQQQEQRHGGLRSLATSAILIEYNVATVSIYSSEDLQSQFLVSIDNGDFDTYLQSYATANSATGLGNATTGYIYVIGEAIYFDDDFNDDLSVGAIVGISIGGVVFLALVATALYCFCCRRKDSPLLTNTTGTSTGKGADSQPGVEL